MEEQYKKTFDQMVDSLKMYQRYELKDKNRKDILDKVYVDPIENDGILNLCLKDNTTVLIGRRGTGKSTIFMRMQNELRKQNDIMTCYIDVKSIFDVAKRNYITINYLKTSNLEEIEQYSIQRQFFPWKVELRSVQDRTRAYRKSYNPDPQSPLEFPLQFPSSVKLSRWSPGRLTPPGESEHNLHPFWSEEAETAAFLYLP